MADHACAAADATFLHRTAAGIGQGGLNMFGTDVLVPDVAEDAVVGFEHHRHAPVGVLLAHLTLGGHQRITHHADAVSVGVGDRRGQQPCLANPFQAGGVTVAVQYVNARKTRRQMRRNRARLDNGHTGMHRAISAFSIEGVVADAYARHVGDGVERPRCA